MARTAYAAAVVEAWREHAPGDSDQSVSIDENRILWTIACHLDEVLTGVLVGGRRELLDVLLEELKLVAEE